MLWTECVLPARDLNNANRLACGDPTEPPASEEEFIEQRPQSFAMTCRQQCQDNREAFQTYFENDIRRCGNAYETEVLVCAAPGCGNCVCEYGETGMGEARCQRDCSPQGRENNNCD
tara:strand:+ start:97 stop:447 length:351 start_codon:yes stop_codon:yes gene_type:complete